MNHALEWICMVLKGKRRNCWSIVEFIDVVYDGHVLYLRGAKQTTNNYHDKYRQHFPFGCTFLLQSYNMQNLVANEPLNSVTFVDISRAHHLLNPERTTS